MRIGWQIMSVNSQNGSIMLADRRWDMEIGCEKPFIAGGHYVE
jgi:hypothetical protein